MTIKKITTDDEVVKISFSDYARMSKKTTSELCSARVGDLIRVRKEFKDSVGIVASIQNDKMCLIINNKKEWWSRYVNYEIISYNNLK